MAKDERLYARFDIGMDEHPKIMLLSDKAFRALFDATLYSRRQMTDGFLAHGIALRKWGEEVAAELSSNDPERPSWIPVEGGWQIHDYAEHQITRADIEAKRDAGRKGGLARAKQTASRTQAPASDVPQQNASAPSLKLVEIAQANGNEVVAKREKELEKETEREEAPSAKAPAAARGSRIPKNFVLTAEMRAWGKENTPLVDLDRKLPEFIDYWTGVPGAKGVKGDWLATWRNGMRKQQEFAIRDNPAAASEPKKRFTAHAD